MATETLTTFLTFVRNAKRKVQAALDRAIEDGDTAKEERLREDLRRLERLEQRLVALQNLPMHYLAAMYDFLQGHDIPALLGQIQSLIEQIESLPENASEVDLAAIESKLSSIEDAVTAINDKVAALEEYLNGESMLRGVFGSGFAAGFTDSQAALEDGVIEEGELTAQGQAWMHSLGSISEGGLTVSELADLKTGKAFVHARTEIFELWGVDEGNTQAQLAFDELFQAAARGELNLEEYNRIAEKYHLPLMNADSFAALFCGVHDSISTGETVDGTMALAGAIHNQYLTCSSRASTERGGTPAQVYTYLAGCDDFYFVDIADWRGYMMEAVMAAYTDAGFYEGMSDEEFLALLDEKANGDLREIIDMLKGKSYFGVDPQRSAEWEQLSAQEKLNLITAYFLERFRAMAKLDEEPPNTQDEADRQGRDLAGGLEDMVVTCQGDEVNDGGMDNPIHNALVSRMRDFMLGILVAYNPEDITNGVVDNSAYEQWADDGTGEDVQADDGEHPETASAEEGEGAGSAAGGGEVSPEEEG